MVVKICFKKKVKGILFYNGLFGLLIEIVFFLINLLFDMLI